MSINERVRECVTFLGILDQTGAFAPYGTGFLASWKEQGLIFLYLVTAKHVVDDMARTGRPLACRLNTRDGGAQFGRIDADDWETHPAEPKCDIAVTNFVAGLDTFDFKAIDLHDGLLTDEYIQKNQIGCADEVFTTGLLTSHFGSTRNVPVVRIGNISCMPDEPVYLGSQLGHQKVYLVESRSIGGLSGSPVFLRTPPFRIVRGEIVNTHGHQQEYALGVNIGLFETKAHGDRVPTDTAAHRQHFLDIMSAGISVVVPMQRVVEIVRDCRNLKSFREDIVAYRDKQTGFVKTSAKPTIEVVPASGEAALQDDLEDWRDPDEAAQLRDEMLRRTLNTPPMPRKGGKTHE